MRSFDFFDEDDSYRAHKKFEFGEKISSTRYSQDNDSHTPLISYDYVVIDEDVYHSFHQECIDRTDIVKYFQILKKLSKTIISTIIKEGEQELHFHIYQPNNLNKTLRTLLKEISGKTLTVEETPSIGQFALYTSRERADREKKIKSPRIYFLLVNATFYILFYDPYHEINSN